MPLSVAVYVSCTTGAISDNVTLTDTCHCRLQYMSAVQLALQEARQSATREPLAGVPCGKCRLLLWLSTRQRRRFQRCRRVRTEPILLPGLHHRLSSYCLIVLLIFKIFMCLIFIATNFPSVLWHCWLGERKGIRIVKNWMLVCWWHFDWSFAHLIAPVVTTASIILSSNNIQNGDILVSANPDPRGKRLLQRRERFITTEYFF